MRCRALCVDDDVIIATATRWIFIDYWRHWERTRDFLVVRFPGLEPSGRGGLWRTRELARLAQLVRASEWKLVGSFHMKNYRSSSTFVTVGLHFHELLPFVQNSFSGLFLVMLSRIWMKVDRKLPYEELQMKLNFQHSQPTFSSPDHEPNAQVSYCHSVSSRVVRKLSHFQFLLQSRLMGFDDT